jgi:hypothetical protein
MLMGVQFSAIAAQGTVVCAIAVLLALYLGR